MISSGAFSTVSLRLGRHAFVIAVVFLAAAAAPVSAARDHHRFTDVDIGRLVATEDGILRSMAGYGEEKLSTVVVTGTLLCSACSPRRPQLLPIPGAVVGVTCKSNSHDKTRNKKPTVIKGTTGENGEFIIDLPSHVHAIPGLEKACFVKVLQLPKHSPCRSTSVLVNRASHAIVLSYVGNGFRTYTAGTMDFRHGAFEDPKGCNGVAIDAQQERHLSY